jgi:hypothetical protein
VSILGPVSPSDRAIAKRVWDESMEALGKGYARDLDRYRGTIVNMLADAACDARLAVENARAVTIAETEETP